MFKRIKSALPLLLGNICLLFLLLAGGLFAFASAYELAPDISVLLACGGFSVLFACLWSVRRGGWAALVLLGLEAFMARWLWEWLEPAVSVIGMAVSGRGRQEPMSYYLMRVQAEETLNAAFLLLAFALACVLGWLAVRERCWHLPAVIVIVPLLPAFITGVLPSLLPLLAQTAGWGTLLLTSLYNRRDARSLAKGIWLNLGGLSALLFLLLALLPQEGYNRPQWATNARDGLINAVTQGFSGLWDSGGGGEGSFWNLDFGAPAPQNEIDGQVDLTEAGPRRYSNQTVLQVIGAKPGRIYLRGGSSAIYTGSGWEALSGSPLEEFLYPPAIFPSLTVPEETSTETITIKHVHGNGDTAYVPYRLHSFPDGLAELSGDGNAVRNMDEYQIAYIPGGPLANTFTPLSGGAAEAELLYRNFVHRHYLDVPEEAENALEQALNTSWADGTVPPEYPPALPGQYQRAAFSALFAAKLLNQLAAYDLDVTPVEPGEDFVTHFLEEGRGYCVHFATAGALMLRMNGIPARYVEGYAPWVGDREVSNVRDSDAHAWVEIYLDGYGWYPVEMTPGRQGEAANSVAPEILQTEAPPVIPEEEPPLEEEEPSEEEPETPDAPDKEDGEAAGRPPDGTERPGLSWIWKAALVLLVLASPYGGYRLLLFVRRKQREHPDTNRSVIYAYLRYQRLRRRGGPEEPELEELGRKAKFSQHQLTEEERTAAWKCASHAAANTKSPLKR